MKSDQLPWAEFEAHWQGSSEATLLVPFTVLNTEHLFPGFAT